MKTLLSDLEKRSHFYTNLPSLQKRDASDELCIDCIHMSQLEGHTAELIGTNINGNPYGIGTKKFPIHFLVIHGSIRIGNPPEIQMEAIKKWFQNEGQVERLVWHCANDTLFKLHRNHVALSLPVDSPSLTKRRVAVAVDTTQYELDNDDSLIAQFGKVNGRMCQSVKDLKNLFMLEDCVSAAVIRHDQNGSQKNSNVTMS